MEANARLILAAFILFLAFAWNSSAHADRRVALVIGNSAYQFVPALPNPANDAGDIAVALRALGFEVIEAHDLNQTDMLAVVRRFSQAAEDADVGLFFYAGHGLQVGGVNYLIPIDAKLVREGDLDFEAVKLDLVLEQLEREAKTAIIFLDACRDNPIAQTLARAMGATRSVGIGRGLARIDSGIGTFVAFSTQPGNVALDGSGRNSPFTAALVNRIGEPGKDLSAIMIAVRNDVYAATEGKQVPWENSSLRSQFFFLPNESVVSKTPTQPVATIPKPTPQTDPAADAWAAAKNTSNISVLEAFIAKYANSFYAELARARLTDLKKQEEHNTLAKVTPQESLEPREKLAVVTVVGAPGDGQQSLAVALKKHLSARGLKFATQPGKGVYSIRGVVKLSDSGWRRQSIRLDWQVFDPSGKQLGTVSQQNAIPNGSLDGSWGAVATAAASAAGDDIIKLFDHVGGP
jgi:uncharacterized caspase-like protein